MSATPAQVPARTVHSGKAQYVEPLRATQRCSFSGVSEARTRAASVAAGRPSDWPIPPSTVSPTAPATDSLTAQARPPPAITASSAVSVRRHSGSTSTATCRSVSRRRERSTAWFTQISTARATSIGGAWVARSTSCRAG